MSQKKSHGEGELLWPPTKSGKNCDDLPHSWLLSARFNSVDYVQRPFCDGAEAAIFHRRTCIMADVLGEIEQYIEDHLAESLEDLRRLTAIPSVSSKHEGIDDAAAFVRELLAGAGF